MAFELLFCKTMEDDRQDSTASIPDPIFVHDMHLPIAIAAACSRRGVVKPATAGTCLLLHEVNKKQLHTWQLTSHSFILARSRKRPAFKRHPIIPLAPWQQMRQALWRHHLRCSTQPKPTFSTWDHTNNRCSCTSIAPKTPTSLKQPRRRLHPQGLHASSSSQMSARR